MNKVEKANNFLCKLFAWEVTFKIPFKTSLKFVAVTLFFNKKLNMEQVGSKYPI